MLKECFIPTINSVLSGSGKGKLRLPCGSVYKGDFRNDEISGFGTMTKPGCYEYTGHWVNNSMHGQGTIVYPDGSSYTGQFVNDLKHGPGKLREAEGTEYEGVWDMDQSTALNLLKINRISRQKVIKPNDINDTSYN